MVFFYFLSAKDSAIFCLIFCQLGICLSSLRIGASYSRNSKKSKMQAYVLT